MQNLIGALFKVKDNLSQQASDDTENSAGLNNISSLISLLKELSEPLTNLGSVQPLTV